MKTDMGTKKFSESLTSYFLLLGSGGLQPLANASEFKIVLRLCNVDSACLWFLEDGCYGISL